jgi:hypothetical protein
MSIIFFFYYFVINFFTPESIEQGRVIFPEIDSEKEVEIAVFFIQIVPIYNIFSFAFRVMLKKKIFCLLGLL